MTAEESLTALDARKPLREERGTPWAHSAWTYFIGASLTCTTVVATVIQQEVMQLAERRGTVDKPSLTIWWNHTCMTFGFPAAWLLHWHRTGSASPARLWHSFLQRQSWTSFQASGYALVLAVMYLMPCISWAFTLKSVSVTLVSAGNRFDAVFVLIFGAVLARRLPSLGQGLAVFGCIIGVVLVCVGQRRAHGYVGHAGIAELLKVMVSPCLGAFYYLAFRRLASSSAQDPENMCMLLGLIGLFNGVALWPVVPLSTMAGLDNQSVADVTSDSSSLRSLGLISLLATISNFSQMPAIALMGPLFVSLGMLLILPSSVLADHLVHHVSVNFLLICGCLVICAGLALSALLQASYQQAEKKDQEVGGREEGSRH
mmetsp:Transcript_107219/g.303222  ORF Transcript_107219/g.303222 Transcript_107219/m.303222 type:complete len:373 (+) Transcript_107219:106-1224(+)|eukprot:CAMPEP_0168412196 /NCGR_PEP_ID=MMETSP0228-20121227/28585_1 /TAXON_ID=133427 /ORGANISM="Protoceratium reticulatum, Strain CCCM 535 (=CCMP 1889)" /LENGTH=372 /DNA_ID=CAMNT_0008425953 /DNA_START=46 /DNA_END=1164 /DNA_ORIENTATION=-